MGMYLLKFPYRRILTPLARRLRWLNPNVVSYAAVPVAAATGWCFYRAHEVPWLLLAAIALTLLRMTLNTLDGIMALDRGKSSLTGEIVNALPDRYADLFVLAGVALSPLCRPWLGLAAIASMALVSYTGMLGKALGVSWQHHGPLGKVERLILLMVAAGVQFFVLRSGRQPAWFAIEATPMEWAMGLFVVLGQVCVLARLRGQLREIARKEASERLDATRNQDRAVVVFDSDTGNTRQVAEHIAAGLGCPAVSVAEAGDLSGCELVVLGSPNIRKAPSASVQRLLSQSQSRPKRLAVFTTFGMPVWGQISSPACLKAMAAAWRMRPVGRFSCPGRHRKYRTYGGHPNKADLLSAFLFGLKLSRTLDNGHGA
ncbi:MAG: hypothetical protein JXL80_08785 [Planctomycetes bacterium]|nr:hypothetical protein [Planctomycetota bacterium]